MAFLVNIVYRMVRCMPGSPHDTQPFADLTPAPQTVLDAVVTTALKAAANSVVITDINGIILWVNPAFTTLTGYPSTDVIGKKPSLFKSGKQGREFFRRPLDHHPCRQNLAR